MLLFESLMQCLSYQAIIWWDLNFQIFIIFCTHCVILHNIFSLQMVLHGAYVDNWLKLCNGKGFVMYCQYSCCFSHVVSL